MDKPNECTRWLEKYPGYRLGYKLIEHDKRRPVIVLIHGLASNHTRWSEFIAQTTLDKRFNILRVDLMGHGLSLQRCRVTRQDWCEDIAAILQQENYSESIIVGHSLGAQVAVEFAHTFPSMCKGIVLIDMNFPQLLHGTLSLVKKLKWLVWCVMQLSFTLNALGIRRRHFELRDMYVLDLQTRIKLADNQTISRLYMNPFSDLRFIPFANYLQDLFELLKPLPELETIHAKVLAIVSSGAKMSDYEATLQQIRRFPYSEIQLIKADHWPLTENPDEVRELIENWCQGLTD